MKYVFYIILGLWGYGSAAQNLYTGLSINKPEDVKTGHQVIELTTEMTFYNPSGSIEKKKEIATLNKQHHKTSELRYNENGILTTRYTCRYDSTGTKSLGRKLERWHPIIGYSNETSTNDYDSNGFLIQSTERNQNKQITMITRYTNDERGNPIEIITEDGNGVNYGMEKAEYDYAHNNVISRVYKNNGELLSETTSKINYEASEDSDIIKNEQGDVIKSSYNEYEYRYDKKGNWVQMTIYKIKNGKKNKQSVFYRKIKYAKL